MINEPFKLYDDELLYSCIARYHIIAANPSYKRTFEKLFKTESITASLEFTGYLENLSNSISKELVINSDYLLYNHTLLPVYLPFLPEIRKSIILKKIKNCSAKDIKVQTGVVAGSILKKEGIMYCPICSSIELKNYGEAYIHRLHQIEGVLICPIHSCYLNTYKRHQNEVSRLNFIKFDESMLEFNNYYYLNDYMNVLIKISSGFNFILSTRLDSFDQNKIHQIYIRYLKKKGFVGSNNRIKQKLLYEEFVNYFGLEVLKFLNCIPDYDNEYNWIKVLTRKPKRVVHPLRQVMFMIFCCGDVKQFFKEQINDTTTGREKFPCLNPTCNNYRKCIIIKYNVKVDNKSGNEIGTFYCKCGFVYSRNMNKDKFSIGKVIHYGEVWERKLADLIKVRRYSIRSIALLMKCDSKTIIKYAEKAGLRDLLPTKQKINNIDTANNKIDLEQYRKDIIDIIQDNPEYNRTEVRKKLQKQYIWLYRHNKEWLNENLPAKSLNEKLSKNIIRVDWKERDEKLLNLIQVEYKRLLQLSNRPRITKSLIGRRINFLSLLEKKLDRLPKTKQYLEELLESVEEFQSYRISETVNTMIKDKEEIVAWKVLRKAGLRHEFINEVKKIIDHKLS